MIGGCFANIFMMLSVDPTRGYCGSKFYCIPDSNTSLETLIDFLAFLVPKLSQVLYQSARPFPGISIINLPFIGPSLGTRNDKKSIRPPKKIKSNMA